MSLLKDLGVDLGEEDAFDPLDEYRHLIPDPSEFPWTIYQGDALEILKTLPDNAYDACFCDPPYGLSFMGKEWDKGVPSAEVWAEVLRVLKPGAPLLAFGGTRMWHRLAVNIEDAGFEIRDTFMWLYGVGFPKALDISKAIDKHLGQERKVIGTKKGKGGENLNKLSRPDGSDSDEAKSVGAYGTGAKQVTIDIEVTEPGSEVSALWEGYKTALKPAWEPIVVAQKPLDGTFAENALTHGVAGYDIDGSRIGYSSQADKDSNGSRPGRGNETGNSKATLPSLSSDWGAWEGGKGRYPSNCVLQHHPGCVRQGTKKVKPHNGSGRAGQDNRKVANNIYGEFSPGGVSGTVGFVDSDGFGEVEDWECVEDCPVKILDGQSGIKTSGAMKRQVGAYTGDSATGFLRGNSGPSNQHGDTGGASRFFYCAKASTSEREAGLAVKEGQSRANMHPTVKSIDLNRYFSKLILPPPRDNEQRKLLTPFSGVGSEMIGALKGGWDHVTGIELQEEYVQIANTRLTWWIYGGGAGE